MCFSPEVSLGTFLIGIIGSILCFSLGTPTDKLVGLFFGFVSSMQGIEFALWKNQNCNTMNKIITTLGMILNHLQPIVLSILILLLNDDLPIMTKQIIILLTIIYAIVITAYSLQFIKDEDGCTLKNEYNHLEWDWNNMKHKVLVYMLFLFMLIFLFYVGTPDKKSGILLSCLSLISYLTSFFIYKDQKVVGALWCIFASFIPILWYGWKKIIGFGTVNITKG
jgi:hypothetical protein